MVVTKRGLYEMFFAGYMADTDLYDGLRQGKILPIAERKKVARIETDLTRDSATKKFKYIKRGFFELNWEKKGDLLRVRNVTFIRRNEEILTVSYVEETGEITSGEIHPRPTRESFWTSDSIPKAKFASSRTFG